MITLETAIAAIVTFLLGMVTGFYFFWFGIKAFKHHAVHCTCCRARLLSLFDGHDASVPEGFCPWRGWYEKEKEKEKP